MKVNTKEFAFDSVFAPESEQKHVFNEVGKVRAPLSSLLSLADLKPTPSLTH
jgi:hypothetical protein